MCFLHTSFFIEIENGTVMWLSFQASRTCEDNFFPGYCGVSRKGIEDVNLTEVTDWLLVF